MTSAKAHTPVKLISHHSNSATGGTITDDHIPDLDERVYCPLAGTCPYAMELPEDVRMHPIFPRRSGDAVFTDQYLTPDLSSAVEGVVYKCQALRESESRAAECAITTMMNLANTAMRFTHELYRGLVKLETGKEIPPVPPPRRPPV